MKEILVGQNLIVSAFSTFPENCNLNFKRDLIESLYDLSLIKKYNPLFVNHHFDLDSGYPECPQINYAIRQLTLSGCIQALDNSPNTYILSGIQEIYNTRIKKWLFTSEHILIREFSEEFLSNLLSS